MWKIYEMGVNDTGYLLREDGGEKGEALEYIQEVGRE